MQETVQTFPASNRLELFISIEVSSMKRAFIVFGFLVFAISAHGQNDYSRGEFFAGFSHGQVDRSTGFFNTQNNFAQIGPSKFNGFNVSGVYNVAKFVGIKADVSGTYNRANFSGNVGTVLVPANLVSSSKNSLYNFLGGVQIKNNASTRRIKPFAHMLVGVGHARTETNATCTQVCAQVVLPKSRQDTGLAGAIGGGFDVKLTDRVDIRAIQIDYNPVKAGNSILHNVRFGIGVVIK
jgi:hypothetical protein